VPPARGALSGQRSIPYSLGTALKKSLVADLQQWHLALRKVFGFFPRPIRFRIFRFVQCDPNPDARLQGALKVPCVITDSAKYSWLSAFSMASAGLETAISWHLALP
jgi:hypothetical protein